MSHFSKFIYVDGNVFMDLETLHKMPDCRIACAWRTGLHLQWSFALHCM